MHSSSCKHDLSSLHATNTMPLLVSSPSANTSSLNIPCFCLSSSTSSRTFYNDIIKSSFSPKYPTFIKFKFFLFSKLSSGHPIWKQQNLKYMNWNNAKLMSGDFLELELTDSHVRPSTLVLLPKLPPKLSQHLN